MTARLKAHGNERGIALVMALVSLLVIAVMAMFLMVNLNVERKLSGHDLRNSQALNLAEAGVGEAMARIRNFDVSLSQANPKAVAQIFLAPAGSVPVLGTDSVGIETKQPAGQWLNYSTSGKSSDALTVQFRTNSARTQIYRYDSSLPNPIQTSSGLPIYRVTSTGRQGANRARISTDIIQKPFNAVVHGAFAADVPMDFSGNSEVCGYDHQATTPIGTRGFANCSAYHTANPPLPGAWSSSTITSTGASNAQNGVPPTQCCNTNMFYSGVWDMLGMGQAEFFNWIGAPVASEPNPPKGLIYLDNNSTAQDKSGSFAYPGGDGEGFLYVDGDLTINGNFTYKGVIYTEGNIKITGTCWILGALACKGKIEVKIANGNFTVLYSKDAIAQALAKYGGQFVTLDWRQVPLN